MNIGAQSEEKVPWLL